MTKELEAAALGPAASLLSILGAGAIIAFEWDRLCGKFANSISPIDKLVKRCCASLIKPRRFSGLQALSEGLEQ